MKKPWYSSQWRQRRKLLLKDRCELCGSSKQPLVLHHWREKQEKFEDYLLLNPDSLITMCKPCHFQWHKVGRLYCPSCEKRRRLPEYNICWACAYPEEVDEEIHQEIRRWRLLDELFEEACKLIYKGESFIMITYDNGESGMTLPLSLVERAKAILGEDIGIEPIKKPTQSRLPLQWG